ncbi:hypothetical protein JCM3770_002083 [Rhodotorula araucariae]
MPLISLRTGTQRVGNDNAGERAPSRPVRRSPRAILGSLQVRRANTEDERAHDRAIDDRRQHDDDLRSGSNVEPGLKRRRSWGQADRPAPSSLGQRPLSGAPGRIVQPVAINTTQPLGRTVRASSDSPRSKWSLSSLSSGSSTGRKAWSHLFSMQRLKFGRSRPSSGSGGTATDAAQPRPSDTPRGALGAQSNSFVAEPANTHAGPSLSARPRDVEAPEATAFPFPSSMSQWDTGATRTSHALASPFRSPVVSSVPLSPIPSTPAYALAEFCDVPPMVVTPRPSLAIYRVRSAVPTAPGGPPAIVVEPFEDDGDRSDSADDDDSSDGWWVQQPSPVAIGPGAEVALLVPPPARPATGADDDISDEGPQPGLSSRFSNWTPTASSSSRPSGSSSADARKYARESVRSAALATSLSVDLGQLQHRHRAETCAEAGNLWRDKPHVKRASTGQRPLLKVGTVG